MGGIDGIVGTSAIGAAVGGMGGVVLGMVEGPAGSGTGEGAVAGGAGADISMFMSDIVMSTGRVWGWFSLPQCSQTQTLRPSANVTSPQLSHLRLAELGSMQ